METLVILRRHRAYYDVIVMVAGFHAIPCNIGSRYITISLITHLGRVA